MRQGKMYRVKNLAKNVRNDCMGVINHGPYQRAPHARLETLDSSWKAPVKDTLHDGDIVACVGVDKFVTDHYESQPFYKVLTLKGEVAYVSKGNRTKYFELVRD